MPSKTEESRTNQRGHLKNELNRRVSFLAEKGLEPQKVSKDTEVRRLRAKLRETESRLRSIAGKKEKLEEMARLKAEKLARPKEDKNKKQTKGDEVPKASKRQEKKKKKQESKG